MKTMTKHKKAWVDMTPEEQKEFKPKKLIWKSESRTHGPTWIESENKRLDKFWNRMVPISVNYRDSDMSTHDEKHTFAAWLEFEEAEQRAWELGIEFEEV